MKILDIGCGVNKHKENPDDVVIGMDRVSLPSVDVIHDMEKFPYPFKDKEFDKVVMHQTLEHVSKENMANVKIIEEIYRILKSDGILEVDVPLGECFYYDPTHKNYVSYWYWLYFSKDFPLNYYTTVRFKMIEHEIMGVRYLGFSKPLLNWLYQKNPCVIERLINFLNYDVIVKYVLKKDVL